MIQSNSSCVTVSISFLRLVPAQFSRMSMRPSADCASAASFWHCEASPSEAERTTPFPPTSAMACRVSSSLSAFVPWIPIRAPAPANATAIARPNPPLAPVTRAVLSLRENNRSRNESMGIEVW